jgi:hypothetical protein
VGVFEDSGPRAVSESLPDGWQRMTQSDKTYYVHLESFTVQLSPPKSGNEPGLHRNLCFHLVLRLVAANDLKHAFAFFFKLLST